MKENRRRLLSFKSSFTPQFFKNNFHIFVFIVSNIVNVQVIIADTSTFDCDWVIYLHAFQFTAHNTLICLSVRFWANFFFKIKRRGRQRERRRDNRFNKQNNSFARTSHFFVYFFPVLHDYDVKMPNLRFMENVNKQRRNLDSVSKLKYGPLKFNFGRVRLQLTKEMGRNNRYKDWKNENSLFKRRSCCRRVVGP